MQPTARETRTRETCTHAARRKRRWGQPIGPAHASTHPLSAHILILPCAAPLLLACSGCTAPSRLQHSHLHPLPHLPSVQSPVVHVCMLCRPTPPSNIFFCPGFCPAPWGHLAEAHKERCVQMHARSSAHRTARQTKTPETRRCPAPPRRAAPGRPAVQPSAAASRRVRPDLPTLSQTCSVRPSSPPLSQTEPSRIFCRLVCRSARDACCSTTGRLV